MSGSYTLVSLSLRLKDLLGPVTRVKKKRMGWSDDADDGRLDTYRGTSLIRNYPPL